MDELYSLRELLKFLQRQHRQGYIVIEAIINLIEYKSDNLPDEKKPQIILETFRKYGLYEVGFEGERAFDENAQKIILPEEPEKTESKTDWFQPRFTTKLEQYNIQVLNATVKFESFLN